MAQLLLVGGRFQLNFGGCSLHPSFRSPLNATPPRNCDTISSTFFELLKTARSAGSEARVESGKSPILSFGRVRRSRQVRRAQQSRVGKAVEPPSCRPVELGEARGVRLLAARGSDCVYSSGNDTTGRGPSMSAPNSPTTISRRTACVRPTPSPSSRS